MIKESELEERLRKVVRKARRDMEKYNNYCSIKTIKTLLALSNYEVNQFKTEYFWDNKTRIYFPVSDNDDNQVEWEITHKIN